MELATCGGRGPCPDRGVPSRLWVLYSCRTLPEGYRDPPTRPPTGHPRSVTSWHPSSQPSLTVGSMQECTNYGQIWPSVDRWYTGRLSINRDILYDPCSIRGLLTIGLDRLVGSGRLSVYYRPLWLNRPRSYCCAHWIEHGYPEMAIIHCFP